LHKTRKKIKHKKQRRSMECEICEELYNETNRQPYLITPCGHCFCLECCNKLIDQSCPKCRGLALSKTINRGLLDLINDSTNSIANNKKRPTTARESKIYQSFDKLLSDIDEAKTKLKQKYEEKLKDSDEVVRLKHEQIQEETNRKMNILLKDTESLLNQLDAFAKAHAREVNECVAMQSVEEEINEFEKNFANFSLNELNEKSNGIKKMVNKKGNSIILEMRFLRFHYTGPKHRPEYVELTTLDGDWFECR